LRALKFQTCKTILNKIFFSNSRNFWVPPCVCVYSSVILCVYIYIYIYMYILSLLVTLTACCYCHVGHSSFAVSHPGSRWHWSYQHELLI
jgi:hypothetical protein